MEKTGEYNIDNAIRGMLVSALNKHRSKVDAMKELKISTPTMYRLIKRYGIVEIKKGRYGYNGTNKQD